MFSIFRLLLVISVSGATHWLVYRWAVGVAPGLARSRRALALALAAVLVAFVVSRRMILAWHSGLAAAVHVVCMTEMVTIALASIPIALLRVSSWLVARGWRASPSRESGPRLTRRQIVEGAGGVALLGTTGAMLGWGVVRGRHAFELSEIPVRVPGLPPVLDGYTLVQVSDIHAGAFVAERELAEGLSLVARARPDAVVVTGDLVDFDPEYARLVARALAGLQARDGVFAILGNHDYYAGATTLVAALRAAGINTLVNEGARVRAADGGGFALLGLDDLWARTRGGRGPDLARALGSIPDGVPRVVLSHQPVSVELWPGRVALQLSGHTHGGQINPGFRLADLLTPYVAGRYEVGGTTLYVNRGFGTVGPPSRVGAPPEVTKVVLVAA